MDRTGVLILRAWVEDGRQRRLRVRITRTTGHRDPSTATVTTSEQACAIVRRWIGELLDGNDSARPGSQSIS